MTKAVSGLMILTIWGAYRLMSRGAAQSAKELLAAGLIGAAIVLPWSLHTHRSFPAESAHELRYALRHVTEPLENQGGPPWQYLAEMPRVYGELIVIPIAWAVVTSFAGGASRSRRAALVWAAIPYLLFSMFATKMPAYVIAAAPAIFLLSAEFWLTLKQRYHGSTAALPKLVMGAGLAVFALLPTRYLVEPHGPLERRDRNPQWARDLRALNDQIGPQKAVVFNARHAVEAMFYTPYVFYAHVPTQNEIDGLTSRGYAVFFYHDGAQPPPAALPRGVAIVGPARRPAP